MRVSTKSVASRIQYQCYSGNRRAVIRGREMNQLDRTQTAGTMTLAIGAVIGTVTM